MKKPQGKAEEVYELAKILEEELKVGDNVKFAPGHQMEGVLGVVAQINPDGTYSVMIGKALQPPVEGSMLVKVGYEQPAQTAQAADDKPAENPA